MKRFDLPTPPTKTYPPWVQKEIEKLWGLKKKQLQERVNTMINVLAVGRFYIQHNTQSEDEGESDRNSQRCRDYDWAVELMLEIPPGTIDRG